jgi:hypothetical protein
VAELERSGVASLAGSTLDISELLAQGLPFAMPQASRTPAVGAAPAAAPVSVPALAGELLGTSGAGPQLTVSQYASLSVELDAQVQAAPQVLARYQVSAADERRFAAELAHRAERDPRWQQAYEAARAAYFAWWQGQTGSTRS